MICASDLIGCELLTESGERLGRVHDLRAEQVNGHWRLTGLLVGRGGIVARLTGTAADPLIDSDLIPWETVNRLGDRVVIVGDDTAPIRPPWS